MAPTLPAAAPHQSRSTVPDLLQRFRAEIQWVSSASRRKKIAQKYMSELAILQSRVGAFSRNARATPDIESEIQNIQSQLLSARQDNQAEMRRVNTNIHGIDTVRVYLNTLITDIERNKNQVTTILKTFCEWRLSNLNGRRRKAEIIDTEIPAIDQELTSKRYNLTPPRRLSDAEVRDKDRLDKLKQKLAREARIITQSISTTNTSHNTLEIDRKESLLELEKIVQMYQNLTTRGTGWTPAIPGMVSWLVAATPEEVIQQLRFVIQNLDLQQWTFTLEVNDLNNPLEIQDLERRAGELQNELWRAQQADGIGSVQNAYQAELSTAEEELERHIGWSDPLGNLFRSGVSAIMGAIRRRRP